MVSEATSLPGSLAAIEPATWRDLNSLRHLEKLCFPKDAWPLLDLVGVLTLPNVVRLKAEVDGLMVGFIAGDIRHSQQTGLDRDDRGAAGIPRAGHRQGAAGGLRGADPRAGACGCACAPRNETAIQLYLNSGYQHAGMWPNYYQDGEDALVMEKTAMSLR